MGIPAKRYLKDFWKYIVGKTTRFPHTLIIVNCYNHIAAFTARHEHDLNLKLNRKLKMKWIRLKYLRLLKSAFSWFEFRSILLELLLILNVKELIVGEGIALKKKFKKPIGIDEILKSVNGTKKKAVYQNDPGNEALNDQLEAMGDAKETYNYVEDLKNIKNHSTCGLATRTFKKYEYVNGYHVSHSLCYISK